MYDHSPNRNIHSLTPSEFYNSTLIQVLLQSLHHKYKDMTTDVLFIEQFFNIEFDAVLTMTVHHAPIDMLNPIKLSHHAAWFSIELETF